MEDDRFCRELVENLFPKVIVEIFGGHKQLLSLPSVLCELQRKYVMLPVDFISDDAMDIVLTMDGYNRPLIAIRVVDCANKENSCFISYHARYSHDMTESHWVTGENSAHSSLNSRNFNRFNTDHSNPYTNAMIVSRVICGKEEPKEYTSYDGYFELFRHLVSGSVIKEDGYDYSKSKLAIYCPFAGKQKIILDKAATEIQAHFRGHLTLAAYRDYKQSRERLVVISKRAGELLGQGKCQEGIALLGEIPQLTDKIKVAGAKLKL
jgi:hypothetical protein